MPVDITAHKPAELSHVAAATLPVAAATAYDGVRQLDLPPGATLLVTGAGGESARRPCRSPVPSGFA